MFWLRIHNGSILELNMLHWSESNCHKQYADTEKLKCEHQCNWTKHTANGIGQIDWISERKRERKNWSTKQIIMIIFQVRNGKELWGTGAIAEGSWVTLKEFLI